MTPKRPIFLIVIICLILSIPGKAQDTKVYTTSGGEIIFSWVDMTVNGIEPTGALRFAPVFNFQNNLNIDFSEKFGLYSGFAIRNVGFIYDVDASTRKKVRSYNLGIPAGFKIGKMDKAFIYAAYELEIPFNYKEKTFFNEQKTKFNVWFSKRTQLQQAVMFGIQFPYGSNIKFKYYFTNFYKKSYTESDGMGGNVQPYANMDVNVFYISLNHYVFKNTDFHYKYARR